ncbi:MAG: response regulator [Fibrobacterales bacterium]
MSDTQMILIVEDEVKIATMHEKYMQAAGYNTHVLHRGDVVEAFVKSNTVDLIILDGALPGKDGFDVCRSIREFSEVPIIIVSARAEDIDRLIGLEIGADDYICKPFNIREVVARVKVVLKRSHSVETQADHKLSVGPIALDNLLKKALVNEIDLDLTATQFTMLYTFIKNPGRVYSRKELVQSASGYEFDGYDFEGYNRTIDTHIKNIRKKLEAVLGSKRIISSVYGAGYRFDADELEACSITG